MIADLLGVLSKVQELAGPEFSGIGILICDTPDSLPVVSLRPRDNLPDNADLIGTLAEI